MRRPVQRTAGRAGERAPPTAAKPTPKTANRPITLRRLLRRVPLAAFAAAVVAWSAGCATAAAPASIQLAAGPEAANQVATEARTIASSDPAAAQTPPRILLVRHGETTPDGTRDPALSDAGRQRAETLARILGDAGVTRVLSTDYRRTRATAEPLARAYGLSVETYDPASLADLARTLGSAGGVIVIVGHSNTTPELVRALGGEPGPPIAETEHDRLYVVVPGGAGVSTLLLRY